MFLMRGDITRWRRSAWRASILRLLGAGCRLAEGASGPVLCDVPTAQPTKKHLTRTDRLNLVNASFSHDKRPIENTCLCYTCQHFTRAYIRHLIIAREMLAATLLSIHNLHVLLQIAQELRQAVLEIRLESYADDFFAQRRKSIDLTNDTEFPE